MNGREWCLRVDRFVLPGGDGGVLRQFLDRHFVAHSVRERARALAARSSLALGGSGAAWRLLPGTSRFAEDAFRGGDAIREALRRTGLDPGGRWIQLLDYPGGRGGSVTFALPDGEDQPSIVVKARPRTGAGPSLDGEWEALVQVRRRLSGDLRDSVPEPLALEVEGGLEVLVLSFLPGRPAYLDMQNLLLPTRRAGAHLEAASRWLRQFHDATVDPHVHVDPLEDLLARDELLERAQAGAGSGVPWADPDLRWYDELREALERRPLHRTAVHGDFWARNLLLGPGPLPGVVDWERYRRGGSPATDLFHFPITYGLNHPWRRYRRLSPLEAFERTFLRSNAVSRGVRFYLLRYARHRGMEIELLRGLFLLHLLGLVNEAWAGTDPTAAPGAQGDLWARAYARFLAGPRSVFSP